MAEYISKQACDELLTYYVKIIAKTLALAEVITTKIPRPAADQPYLILRSHNNRTSYLCTFRALNLLEEFALTILPAIGLPTKNLKNDLYWPNEQVYVTNFENKPFYNFMERRQTITSKQSRNAWMMLERFEHQLHTPVDVRWMFYYEFKVGNHPMISILDKPYLARERAEKIIQLIHIRPQHDDHIQEIYSKISYSTRPSKTQRTS